MVDYSPKTNILNPQNQVVWVDVSPFPFGGIFRLYLDLLEVVRKISTNVLPNMLGFNGDEFDGIESVQKFT